MEKKFQEKKFQEVEGATLVYARSAQPKEYENARWELTVKLKEGADIERNMTELEDAVDFRLAANEQRRLARQAYIKAMWKVHVPVEDLAEAHAALGPDWPVPVTALDYEVIAQRIPDELINVAVLWDGWMWFRDGKHPHPRVLAARALKEKAEAQAQASDQSPADADPIGLAKELNYVSVELSKGDE